MSEKTYRGIYKTYDRENEHSPKLIGRIATITARRDTTVEKTRPDQTIHARFDYCDGEQGYYYRGRFWIDGIDDPADYPHKQSEFVGLPPWTPELLQAFLRVADDSYIIPERMEVLRNLGLIQPRSVVPQVIVFTPKGKALLDMLLATPLPIEKVETSFADPRD